MEIEKDRKIANWGLQIEAACKKLRKSQVLSAGEIQLRAVQCNSRQHVAFHSKLTKLVDKAKDVLKTFQNLHSNGVKSNSLAKSIEDLFDGIGEKIDAALDRHEEKLKGSKNAVVQQLSNKRTRTEGEDSRRTKHICSGARPQDSFVNPPDNSCAPFWPDFSHLEGIATDLTDDAKPVPANLTPEFSSKDSKKLCKLARYAAQFSQDNIRVKTTYSHPFAKALSELPTNYPSWMLAAVEPQAPKPLEDTPLLHVDNAEALRKMAEHLSRVGEFAVDLEHSNRSFQGFTCLMQVSTRTHDYIVDTLAVRHLLGSHLAAIFAQPSILKVLHGAVNDIQWLQKDFGLFVVNMFDTGQAAALLGLPRGLAGLLQHFCDIKADKSFQKADWRQRPLSDAMLHYARSDTHFLLYIADCLRQKLHESKISSPSVNLPISGPQGLIGAALELSRQLCLMLYEKPQFSCSTYMKQYQKMGVELNSEQLSAFAALSEWRDRTARSIDEGPAYVLPVKLWLRLARRLPVTASAVGNILKKHKCFDYASEIAEVIKYSQEHKLEPAEELDIMASRIASEHGHDSDCDESEGYEPGDSSSQDPEEESKPDNDPVSASHELCTLPSKKSLKAGSQQVESGPPPHLQDDGASKSLDGACTERVEPQVSCGKSSLKTCPLSHHSKDHNKKKSAGFDLSFIPTKKVFFKKSKAHESPAAGPGVCSAKLLSQRSSAPTEVMQEGDKAQNPDLAPKSQILNSGLDSGVSMDRSNVEISAKNVSPPKVAGSGQIAKAAGDNEAWDLGTLKSDSRSVQFSSKKTVGGAVASKSMARLFGDSASQRCMRPCGPLPELATIAISQPVPDVQEVGVKAHGVANSKSENQLDKDSQKSGNRGQKEEVGAAMALLSTGLGNDSEDDVEKTTDKVTTKEDDTSVAELSSLRERHREGKRKDLPESRDRLGDLTRLPFGHSKKHRKARGHDGAFTPKDEMYDYSSVLDGSDKIPSEKNRREGSGKRLGQGRGNGQGRRRGNGDRKSTYNVFEDSDFPRPQRTSNDRGGNRTAVFRGK